MDPVELMVRRVAAVGLMGAPDIGDGAMLQADEWLRLQEMVREQRLQGCLAAALREGSLSCGPWAADAVRDTSWESVAMTFPLLVLLTETVDLLARSGIEARVLKGAALAQLDYPTTMPRSYIDVDLLVRPRDFDQALAVMARAGHGRRGLPERRPGFDRRFAKDVTFVTAAGRGVDLHRTFTVGPFGQAIDVKDLWTAAEEFTVSGQRLSALPVDLRFLGVCFHAALGAVPARLLPVRDVAQILLSGRVDVDHVLELARSWRAEIVLARALELVTGLLGVPLGPLGQWAADYAPAEWERRALRPYLQHLGPGAERSLETVRLIPTLAGKARYAHAQLFPSRIYLEGRYDGYRQYWTEHARDWAPGRG